MKQETFTDMTKLCLQTERHQKLLTTLLKKSESFTTHFEELFELQSLATSYKGVTYYDN